MTREIVLSFELTDLPDGLLEHVVIAAQEFLDDAGADYRWVGHEVRSVSSNGRRGLKDPAENQLGPFRGGDPPTSRKAALNNYPRSGSQRHRVLLRIAYQPASRDEIAEHLSLPDSSVDARVWELLQGEFVSSTGKIRKTRNGSDAEVLAITDKAREWIMKKDGLVS